MISKPRVYRVDGLTHLTENGLWLDGKRDARVETLLRQMEENQVELAVLTGLPGIISNETVSLFCRRYPSQFIGFGAVSPKTPESPREVIKRVKDLGLCGIKFHSRLGAHSLDDPKLVELVDAAAEMTMPIMVCGVVEARGWSGGLLPHEAVGRWADRHPEHPFILVHAGSHRILDSWAMARARENVYLDLSHTLNYFEGSSVKKDIGFVGYRLNKRVLFGSDFPEYSLDMALKAVEELAAPWSGWDHTAVNGGTWLSLLRGAGIKVPD